MMPPRLGRGPSRPLSSAATVHGVVQGDCVTDSTISQLGVFKGASQDRPQLIGLPDGDETTLREFWTKLDNDQMQFCSRCQESWFQMNIDTDGICARCYRKDAKRGPREPYFFSADNQLDFGPVSARLPELTPTEESLIARVHAHVNIMLVRGQQYKYRGHVVHFLREVGLVYNQLPLLPQELNTVLLRPANTSSHANLSRQFTRQFRVRRQAVVIWLNYLRRHHPGYRCIVIDEERLSQLPENGNILDAIPQSQVEAADVGPEEDHEAEPDLEDEAAVPDLLAKDTELDALRAILTRESEADAELPTNVQARPQHELQLPNIRHTPINEFNRSHALLSLAFPASFLTDYIEHAMRWHDGRFARHPTFRFVAFNTLMRSQHSEDPEAQALINSITRHAVSIRGTRPFWNKKRQDLEAYAYNLGCPAAFITFSPADLHWRSLYQHMPRYEEWLAASESERMALSRQLLRQNPHIAAFHFYRRYCFFRDIVLRKKFNVTDYWDRYEWQGRVMRKEGRSYFVFEAARNDSLMNHFNPAIVLGWLANIDISPCTSLQAVITYAAKYCSKSEKKTEPYCKLADQVLPHTAHLQPLLSFSSRLMNKLIAERDYSAQEISHLLLNIPLQEGTRMVVYVDCRPLEHHARSYRVDDDVNETVGSYQKYLERNGQHERVTYLEYLQSYNLKTWRILCANAKKRLMMVHPHRYPEELLTVGGQRFESFAAAYQYCRQQHHSHEDDHYGEPGAKELRAEDDQFELEEHVDPVVEEDWHELARMLPDHPLGEEDIDILGRRDLDQRLVYDTVMDHFLTQHASQLLLHVDGGGGTGKSYLINILSAHLQAAAGGRGTPVWRAAPTGVAGNQISGTTLHSLLHLPINKDFKPLLAIDKAQLQKKLKDVKYLIIDEKSMLGLRQLSWIDDRLREAFPNRNEEFFGGLNILAGVEIKGRNAYRRFDKTVFLNVVQRQRGDDQEAFRTALGAKLDDREVAKFDNALRVYATKDRVNEFNHYHLDRLGRPVIQVMAKNVGPGAAAAPDDKPVGLCNGARGTVHDIGWAPGADPIQDPPCVIMMEFDKYSGPVFLTTPDGRKIVPILPVERDFLIGATLCTRTQFPLIVCYAITVHKSQSITEDMVVTDLSCRDFQTGLSYVAVSRVKTLQGLMLDAPFDRNHLTYASPPEGIKMKMRDQEIRRRQVLTRNPYETYHGPA
ncbi:PIF1-like helicase domain-containing protein [Hirsutella rhossiliensis]|uniref:ATP-dependent DNA helicase n=1 Tax=Hirsutella rhossiliensis TaxID=111463 RepID=A0A9P8N420_9HYPO|nr:PIF1-like helicase domain-containing protein [Hirsutella rhossiliensis]KAH0966202.1 PIF1-like helicase domain-containing protein [Hirsutella rhossiliensis]